MSGILDMLQTVIMDSRGVRVHLNDMVWCTEFDDDIALALKNNNQSLKVLDLTGCCLTDDRVAKFVRVFVGSGGDPNNNKPPKLEVLNLSGNQFTQETSIAIADLLLFPPLPQQSSLRELYLNNERYQHKRNREKLDIKLIANSLRYNTTMKILDLSDNLINDEEFEALVNVLMAGVPVPASPDGGGEQGGIEEGSAMIILKQQQQQQQHNNSLERLVLARNRITDNGFSKFRQHYLPNIRGLKSLALWGNLMEDTTTTATTTSRHGTRGGTTRNHDDGHYHYKVLRNQAIKVILDLEDIDLLKIVSFPEKVPLGLWPLFLHRVQEIIHKQQQQQKTTTTTAAAAAAAATSMTTTKTTADALFLLLRSPMMMSALNHSNFF